MNKKEFSKGKLFSFAESIEYSDQAIVSKTVLKNPKGNVSLFAFDKGEELSEHTAPFDALVQIVDGVAEIIIDGAVNVLYEGHSIIMPSNIPHAVKARKRFKMVLTMIKD
jgi:quercetin dioxygenase-like cupin family protein